MQMSLLRIHPSFRRGSSAQLKDAVGALVQLEWVVNKFGQHGFLSANPLQKAQREAANFSSGHRQAWPFASAEASRTYPSIDDSPLLYLHRA